ncbi:MAG: lipid-A-disaccharide synthase [Puia sp.]|nr:lipid-A-disaccharide synthase [Puia sp.]
MKYYMISGEASGDLHGSNLIKEIKNLDPRADIRAWGGDLMEAAGAKIVKHYKDLAFMGFAEIVKNLPTILQNLRFCKDDILSFAPDALILIDYPGFNMRIAKWAHQKNLRIIYYISPQVWAWKENRVRQIRKFVDKMLVILPFEKEFYRKWDYEVEYVGHPLVEVVEAYKRTGAKEPLVLEGYRYQSGKDSPRSDDPAGPGSSSAEERDQPIPGVENSKPIVALLPGSRKQEILKKLPVMLEVSRVFPDHAFVVAKAPGQEDSFYRALLENYPNVYTVSNQTYSLLLHAKAACVTSGTATLETALFGVPEVVCYKGSAASYQIAKRLIKVKYISLVNLIMDKLVVKELIQDDLTPDKLRQELQQLLHDPGRREQLRRDYDDLTHVLSQGGHASANAARSIVGFLQTAGSSQLRPGG